MRLRPDADRGAAVVELALLLSVMFAALALVLPIGQLFIEKMRVGRAAGVAARFASATPDSPAYGSSARRPTDSDVQQAALDAYTASGGSATGFTVTDTLGARPGDVVTVTATKVVDLGALASVLQLLHVSGMHTVAVSASASGREE